MPDEIYIDDPSPMTKRVLKTSTVFQRNRLIDQSMASGTIALAPYSLELFEAIFRVASASSVCDQYVDIWGPGWHVRLEAEKECSASPESCEEPATERSPMNWETCK